MSLRNGYHGETIMTLAVSDLGLYKKPFEKLCPKTSFIDSIPYVDGRSDPAWTDSERAFKKVKKQLAPVADKLSAIVVEPILQAAGGMKIYSADFLRRLREWCTEHDVHLIADEIMTSFGRTGKMLACEHAGIEPDFLCLGKGLTAGWLPMSATLTSSDMYRLFYDDYETGKAFMHSHTHTGNALAVAIALENLKVFNDENILSKAAALETTMQRHMGTIAKMTDAITNIRAIGGVVAADLKPIKEHPRLGYAVYLEAVKQGALLRPLGNTLYWTPPINTTADELAQLADITETAIHRTLSKIHQKGRISHNKSDALLEIS
jgi:adenosylmethionine-8-amino-7-oxononanoate aminotransferase